MDLANNSAKIPEPTQTFNGLSSIEAYLEVYSIVGIPELCVTSTVKYFRSLVTFLLGKNGYKKLFKGFISLSTFV